MLRLIGIHHAGGSASALLPLRRWFASSAAAATALDFQALELPGHGARYREALYEQRSTLVRQLGDELTAAGEHPRTQGPYVLFGHSLGGMLAYELAQDLIARGERAPSMLFIAASPAPSVWPTRTRGPLSDPELKAELQRRGGTPPELFEHPELMSLFMPVVRADFALCDEPSPAGCPPLPCPVHVIGGTQDECTSEQLEAWQLTTDAAFSLTWLEADHFFPRTHTSALGSLILQRLAAAGLMTSAAALALDAS